MNSMIDKELRVARAIANISKSELSKKSGVSWSQIANIEKGKHSPSISILEKLAPALNCNLMIRFVPKNELAKI